MKETWGSLKRGLALAGIGIIIWGLGSLVALDELGVEKQNLLSSAFGTLDARAFLSALFLAAFLLLWLKFSAPRRINGNHLLSLGVVAVTALIALSAYLIGRNQSDVGMNWAQLDPFWIALAWHAGLAAPAAIYFWAAVRIRSGSNGTPGETGHSLEKVHLGFLNQIFAPSVLFCMSLFSMGVYAAAGSGYQNELLGSLLALGTASSGFALLFLFAVHTDKGVLLYIPYIGFGLIVSFSASVIADVTWAKLLTVAIALTFALGVAEVGKRYAQIASGKLQDYEDKDARYFLLGANWSAAVFPGFTLVMISTFKDFSFIFTAIVVSIFLVSWLHMTDKRKRAQFGEYFALSYGFLLPISIGVGVIWGSPVNDWFGLETKVSDVVLALLAQVAFAVGLLRLAKDTVGVPLDNFFADIWSPENYLHRPHCLFLLLTVNSLIVILLLLLFAIVVLFPVFAGSLDSIVALGKKLANSGFIITFVSLVALMGTFATPGSVSRLRDERDNSKLNTDRRDNQENRTTSSWQLLRLFIQSGRPGVSWIAGSASVAVGYSVSSLEFLTATSIFFSMTLLTMFGFVVNDISDRQKDRAAGKIRPITTGALPADVAAFLATIVLIGALLASLQFGPVALSSSLLVAAALIQYSKFSSKFPLYKGPYTAALCVSPFLFANAAIGVSLNISVILVVFVFILFREILLDAEDADGDESSGLFTVAHLIGQRRAAQIGWVGMTVTLFVGQFVLTNFLSVIVIYFALASLVAARLIYRRNSLTGVKATRASMLLGVFAAAIG